MAFPLKPQVVHSPSMTGCELLTIEDLFVYRVPLALPVTRQQVLPQLGQPNDHNDRAFRPLELRSPSIYDLEDDPAGLDDLASPSNDPFTTASLSPFSELLKLHGVIGENTELPINLTFSRSVRGRKNAYFVKITVESAQLSSPGEAAGPFRIAAQGEDPISSRLGNLRVHVYALGVQIWYLGVGGNGSPTWNVVTSPGKDTRHPDTVAFPGRCLSIYCGAAVPTWVTQKTATTYMSRRKGGN
ncbi:hypothetical protein BKA62DRAFT_719539 [Auriculariales sp. MPI-PUGE-AT-0066]|nr:hypothetical protein BKA62DRAFT_719539 [Auriculariales sp. MPI-PUGE-AT-0066]